MKVKHLLEASAKLGLMISRVDGKFEDIDLLDWESHSHPKSSHSENLFKGLVSDIREHGDNDFEEFAEFAKKKFNKKGIKLGDDFADQEENDSFMLYGPLTDQDIVELNDQYLDHVGYEEYDPNDPDNDPYHRHGVKRSDFY